MVDTAKLNELSQEIHNDNIVAGWWTDLNTGESIVETRSRPEMLMLVVTELSEASHGYASQLKDDKLPQYDMDDVELADAAIRLHDLAGAEGVVVTPEDVPAFEEVLNDFTTRVTFIEEDFRDPDDGLSVIESFMLLVDQVSATMEAYRKPQTRATVYKPRIARALVGCYVVAGMWGVDLDLMISEKRAYNKNREDHKIANRLKSDGKKC